MAQGGRLEDDEDRDVVVGVKESVGLESTRYVCDERLFPHLQQEENWDCGLASLRMVLIGAIPCVDIERFSNQALLDIVQTKSIWTIDLAYALAHFKVPFVFFTTCTHVKKSAYSGMPFYKEIDRDESRVNKCFAAAKMHGVQVYARSISKAELRGILTGSLPLAGLGQGRILRRSLGNHSNNRAEELERSGIVRCAIVLVDVAIMRGYTRPDQSSTSVLGGTMQSEHGSSGSLSGVGRWFLHALQENLRNAVQASQPIVTSSYSGHYIVLIRYKSETDEYVYRDPAASTSSSIVSAEGLEKARKATGTDEDILFIDVVRPSSGL